MNWTWIALVVIVAGCCQVAIGVWLGRMSSLRKEPGSRPHADSDKARQLHRIAKNLYHLATSTADDLNHHESEITQITRELDKLPEHERALTGALFRLVARTVRANKWLRRRLTKAEGQLRRQAELARIHAQEAQTDPLTGLLNRRAFDLALERLGAVFHQAAQPFSLILLDVDHFKQLNDQYGHPMGDRVLCHLANVLKKAFRTGDVVCRIGGEEFAVLLPGTKLSDAAQVAERVRRLVAAQPAEIDTGKLAISVSLGVAEIAPEESCEDFVARADRALYAAKAHGRNRTFVSNTADCVPASVFLDGQADSQTTPVAANVDIGADEKAHSAAREENPAEPADRQSHSCADPELDEMCQQLRHQWERIVSTGSEADLPACDSTSL